MVLQRIQLLLALHFTHDRKIYFRQWQYMHCYSQHHILLCRTGASDAAGGWGDILLYRSSQTTGIHSGLPLSSVILGHLSHCAGFKG